MWWGGPVKPFTPKPGADKKLVEGYKKVAPKR